MDEVKELLQYQLAGSIDFKGQEIYDFYTDVVAYGGIAVSTLVGMATGDFKNFLYGIVGFYTVSVVISLPLPVYRRNPVSWRKTVAVRADDIKVNL